MVMSTLSTDSLGSATTHVPSTADVASSVSYSFTWGAYFQTIGMLLLLLGLLWGCLWCVRRFGLSRRMASSTGLPRNALQIEAQLPLGARKGVMLVRCLDKRLLLGVTEQHITFLTEFPLSETSSTPVQASSDGQAFSTAHTSDSSASQSSCPLSSTTVSSSGVSSSEQLDSTASRPRMTCSKEDAKAFADALQANNSK